MRELSRQTILRISEENKRIKNNCKVLTECGVCVQSEGEREIANYLFRKKIKFEYDCLMLFRSLNLDLDGGARPDFYLPEIEIVIEDFE